MFKKAITLYGTILFQLKNTILYIIHYIVKLNSSAKKEKMWLNCCLELNMEQQVNVYPCALWFVLS